jgi:hypothetical protein
MKISKKLVSFMLALAMVVSAMAVQTVPVQAATEISFDNVNKKSITIRAGGVYTFKTNYKASELNYKTSNKSIVKSLGNGKIKAVKKGTAKVTVSLKNDATVKATVTVHVQSKPSSNCKITLSRICESLVEETYNKKTKKSDYRIYIDTEHLGGSKKNVAAQLSVSVKGMQPGCEESSVGSYDNDSKTKECLLDIHLLTKADKDYYVPGDIETMTLNDWYNIFKSDYTKAGVKAMITKESNSKYYKVIVNDLLPYALVKDKDSGNTYFVQYLEFAKNHGNTLVTEKAKKNYIKVLKSFKLQNFTYDELGYRY